MDKKEHQNDPPVYDFGWWPEIIGAIGVALLIWFLISNARGIM